jgi:hypothetical protein
MLVLLVIIAVLIVGVLLGRMGDRTRDGEGMSPVARSGVLSLTNNEQQCGVSVARICRTYGVQRRVCFFFEMLTPADVCE